MRNFKLTTEKPDILINYNDALFKAVFDESPDAIFLINPGTFTIADCNIKSLQLFQAEDKSQLAGINTFLLYESEPVEFSKNIFVETINSGKDYSQEMAFKSLKGNVFWGRCTIRKVDIEGGSIIVFRVRRVVDYMKTAEMLANMIKRTSKTAGFAYFSELTELLSKTFGVCTALIAKVDSINKTATAIHCWHKSQPLENLTFELETGPSLNVMRGYPTFYPNNLKEMFPDDKLVKKLDIEGYLGTPVYNSTGEVCGLLILMDDKPMEEIPNSRYILSIFASRAGTELDRIKIEDEYKRYIGELEERIRDKR